ncbi:MAG: Rieske (2Fe-2S) protein [Capsulimonadaceae bacterium]|nr:Rieske (2Fe-2S) protein [Capsulimonadaceae bacterium]
MSEAIVEDNEQLQPDEEGFTRRGFVKVAIGGMGVVYAGAIGYPIYRYLETPVEKEASEAAVKAVDLKDADKLPAGSTLMFMFGSKPAMLIHFATGEWVSLSAVCQHLGCILHYQPPAPRIVCACHGGQYDPHTGENVAGPPPRPLRKYIVKVLPGHVTVSKA